MQLAKRLDELPPYLFLEISKKIQAKRAEGVDIVSFGIGDPDIPTPQSIVDALVSSSASPENHRYPESDGLPALREAISSWYERRFGFTLDPNKQVLPLIGAKEGIGHMALCTLNPGDIALVPDPGYPVYSIGTMFAGGQSHFMPLKEENHFLPDLTQIDDSIAQKAKVMWLNYPNNPTAGLASTEFLEEVVSFAKRHNIIVCYDAAYSEVTFDGYKAPSFLEIPGAIDIGIEFHSLSKTYNMTGWRIGMAVGNATLVDALLRVKSNIDSGIPQAIQQMGIEALTNTSQEWIDGNNEIYRNRRNRMIEVLKSIGLHVNEPKAGLYVWAKAPEGWKSAELASELLETCNVVVTPGRGFGPSGEGYIRLSLTTPDDRVEEGLRRLSEWRAPKNST